MSGNRVRVPACSDGFGWTATNSGYVYQVAIYLDEFQYFLWVTDPAGVRVVDEVLAVHTNPGAGGFEHLCP